MQIEYPFPPATLSGHSNGNNRWGKIAETKRWRDVGRSITLAQMPTGIPATGDIAIDVMFIPPDNRGDRWNMPQRAKALIDGIADALDVNDKRFLPTIRFGKPVKPGKVIVTIGD